MLVIFDWDGTLSHSLPRIIACVHAAAAEVGAPARSDQQISSIVGLGLGEALAQLYFDCDTSMHAALVKAYRKFYPEIAQQIPAQLFDGVLTMLDRLRSEKLQLAVATGKAREGLNAALSECGLSGYFDASRCADETRSKPHPMMLTQILDELSCEPQQACMVGDTDFDLNMGHNAGVKTIAVATGAHPPSQLQDANPGMLLESAADIRVSHLQTLGLKRT